MVVEKALEAAKFGDLDLLESLNLSRCLNEQVSDNVGATCIHYAARAGNLEVLEYLVTKCGFRGNKRSKIGATAAHDASATGNLECLQFLLDFLKTGCQVDDTDATGATVLHLGSRFGHYAVVRWILENTECNCMRKTAVGALPLHFAAARGDLRIVRLLVRQSPSSVNMQMSNGVTSVYLACQEGHLEVLKFLVLQAGGSLKIPAHDGMKCIHAAAQSGHLNILTYLIVDQNMDPNGRDFEGTTPIHFASSRGHTKVLKWLLLHGGKITLDNLGGSPLHDAAEHGQLESISVLLEHGCDPSIPDNNGLTAEELADHCLHRECAILIKQFRPQQSNGHVHDVKTQNLGGQMNGHHMSATNGMNGHSNHQKSDFDDDDPLTCVPTTVVVEVEVHRTSSGAIPAKRQCMSAETGEHHYSPYSQQGAAPARPVSYPPSSVMSDNHSELSSTTSSLSTLSYHDRSDLHDSMTRSVSDHSRSMHSPAQHDTSFRGYSHSHGHQMAPPSPRNRGLPEKFPHNEENEAHSYHYRNDLSPNRPMSNEISYNQGNDRSPHQAPPSYAFNHRNDRSPMRAASPMETSYQRHDQSGTPPVESSYLRNDRSPNRPTPPSEVPRRSSSAFEDEIRQQSLKMQSRNRASNYLGEVEMKIEDRTPSAPPPPPMPPPPPPSGAPPAPPLTGLVKENIAKLHQADGPYQFAKSPTNSESPKSPSRFKSPMQPANRPNTFAKEKAKSDELIAELKSVNMGVASLRKVRKDSGNIIFDSSSQKPKTSPSPGGHTPSPVDMSKLSPDMPFESFLAEIPETDKRGVEVPSWRRQLLARQLMEKIKKESDEQRKIEEEENKFKNMPAWKRDMVMRKKAERETTEKENEPEGGDHNVSETPSPSVDDDGNPIPPWKQEFMQRRK